MIESIQSAVRSKRSTQFQAVSALEKREHMSDAKAVRFAAKDVAALLHMSAKNLRKHLRNLEIAKNAELQRYSFTQKQCDAIVAKIEERVSKQNASNDAVAEE